MESVASVADLFCPNCGYNLRGVLGDCCPECGYALAGMRSAEPAIPWVRRRENGRVRTFWQTVWLVTFNTKRFCEESARTVSFADARAFLWVTLLHVHVSLLAATACLYLTVPVVPEPDNPMAASMAAMMGAPAQALSTMLDRAYGEVWPVAILLACLMLYLACAAVAPSYLFHPRALSARQQDNGIAMSYYACGPLALWPLMMLALVPATNAAYVFPTVGHGVLVAAAIATGAVVVGWWVTLMSLARRTMPQLKRQRLTVAIGLPVLWLTLAGLILVGLPFIVLSILVVLDSLR